MHKHWTSFEDRALGVRKFLMEHRALEEQPAEEAIEQAMEKPTLMELFAFPIESRFFGHVAALKWLHFVATQVACRGLERGGMKKFVAAAALQKISEAYDIPRLEFAAGPAAFLRPCCPFYSKKSAKKRGFANETLVMFYGLLARETDFEQTSWIQEACEKIADAPAPQEAFAAPLGKIFGYESALVWLRHFSDCCKGKSGEGFDVRMALSQLDLHYDNEEEFAGYLCESSDDGSSGETSESPDDGSLSPQNGPSRSATSRHRGYTSD